jgi:glycerol-3-phosphate acyltransferase PlsY
MHVKSALEEFNLMEFGKYAAILIGAYLIGSFPTGYLMARWFRGVDPRQHGSGRTGGTNILRTAGKGAALATVAGDLLKGALAVLLARVWMGTQPAMVLAGLAAVLGHNRSIFLRFRGGAGSMTNAGVVLVLAPHVVPVMAATAFIAAKLSRMASVTSIATVVAMVITMLASFLLSLTPVAYVVYGVLACALILLELRPNIHRLRAGSERRVESY